MNISVFFQKRFLFYALLLHGGIAASFALFDSDDAKETDELNPKRIVEVDVSKPIDDNAIMAETFSSEEIEQELIQIESMSESFKSNTKLNDANIKEKEKELKALEVHSKKAKDKLLKEKKKLQIEKKRIQDEKDRALKEKNKIEKEKEKMKKELERLREEAKKKALAKQKKEMERAKRLAEEKRLAKIKAAQKPKKLSPDEWLKTNSGMAEFNRYTNGLMGKVKDKWIKPSDSKSGWACKVEIKQTAKGQIKGIRKIKCNPNNEKFYQSVHRAVMQSSPLPLPNDKRLFDNKITITFSVD